MHKHSDIIAKLTDSQKIRLLTGVGSLTGRDFKILGIGGVVARNMKDYGRDEFPHTTALAHAWDKDVWQSVAAMKTRMMLSDGVGLAIAPGAKIKISPFRREVSEDPLFAAEISAAHAKAAKEEGLTTALSGCYLTDSDVEWLDKEPSERAIAELVTAPYLRALALGGADAVATDERTLPKAYEGAPEKIYSAMPPSKIRLCERATDENTVRLISSGVICLSASANALESAFVRYKKLFASAERGEGVTPEQIAEEERDGTVISPETLDAAIDRTLDFIETCNVKRNEGYSEDALKKCALEATASSVVLLKNENDILPLSRTRSVALIGGIFPEREDGSTMLDDFAEGLNKRGYKCVGAAKGYDTDDIFTPSLRDRALKMAEPASVVILFLGFGYENEKRIQKTETLSLPANQLQLADALVKKGKRVIGVIASGHAPDIDFTRDFDALMLAPLYVNSAAEALLPILSGERSPSGKLAYTLYAGSDAAFRKRMLYTEKYGMKSGTFVGYRYYETAGITVGYPFGHGLTYSRFALSELKILGGKLSFTVENTGERTATETVQIYVGRCGGSVLRPKKELCGFVRVSLRPHGVKRVSMPLQVPTVYNRGSYVVDGGDYTVYVGTSSDDDRLKTKTGISGSSVRAEGGRLIDYVQSVSNVKEDKFTLEASYSLMKKPIKNILFGAGALLIAACLAIFNFATGVDSVFLGVLAGVVAIFAIAFFAVDVSERTRIYKEERERIAAANEQHFSGAEEIPVLSTDAMFREEFDGARVEKAVKEDNYDDSYDEIQRKYVEPAFKIKDAAADLARFAESKGMKLDAGVAESILTSLATSKLMIVSGLSSEEFNSFVMLVSEYFGAGAYIDSISSVGEDMFFTYDTYGNHAKRPVLLALDAAGAAKERLSIAAMDRLDADSLKDYLKPFLFYLNSTKEHNEITIYNEKGSNVGYDIPRNLRLIVRLSELTPADTVSDVSLKFASYNRIGFVRCQQSAEFAVYHGCNRYQLEWMLSKEGRADAISEESYKRIDKLEKYVAAHADYSIGNKLWINLERQIGLLVASECEVAEAIDRAVAMRLLPSMTSALKDRLTEDDETVKETLEFIFGEDNISECNRFLSSLQETYALVNEREQARIAEEKARADAEAAENERRERELADYAERARREEEERREQERSSEVAHAAAMSDLERQVAEMEAKARAEAKARIEEQERAAALENAQAEERRRAEEAAAELEIKARIDAEARYKAEMEAKARAEAQARLEAEAKAKSEAEAQIRLEAEAKARAEAQARLEAEAKAKAEAEAQARLEAEAKERALAEAQARLEAEAKAKAEAEAKAKAEAEARAKAAANSEREKAIADAEARIKALMAGLKKTDKK